MLSSYERELIQRTLQQFQFNVSRAAEKLGLSRHALRYRMQRLKISPDPDVGRHEPSSDKTSPA
jgi:DNA-binding NtrC family response regulator